MIESERTMLENEERGVEDDVGEGKEGCSQRASSIFLENLFIRNQKQGPFV